MGGRTPSGKRAIYRRSAQAGCRLSKKGQPCFADRPSWPKKHSWLQTVSLVLSAVLLWLGYSRSPKSADRGVKVSSSLIRQHGANGILAPNGGLCTNRRPESGHRERRIEVQFWASGHLRFAETQRPFVYALRVLFWGIVCNPEFQTLSTPPPPKDAANNGIYCD